jgi:hypothetical protein
MGDKVNHPDHYQNIAGVEAIDILNDVVKDLPGTQAALLWNSMKYLFRFQKKNGLDDLKKARNYLDYLIADMEANDKVANGNGSEILWDTWFSNEYGNMTIYSKTKKPNGMPSKLVFDTKDAVEEFQSVFYNLLSEGYDEFSITDAALEMKFRTTKGNEWNNWDEPINWKELHNNFTIVPFGDKYELIFGYNNVEPKEIKTDHGPCVIYKSKISGHVEVYYTTQMYPGMCTTLAFTSELTRDMFISNFFNQLKKKKFSIRDVLANTNFIDPDGTDNFSTELPWKDLFAKFKMGSIDGKYYLDFVYKSDALDALEEEQPTSDKCISYHSSVWGNADVYYSTDMPQGTCTKILFDDKGGRDTFAIKFFRYLSVVDYRFSIQDILEDARYLFPKEDNSLHFTMPWNEIFKGFHITDEAGKYALEFIIDLQGGK